jgi:hypothetical protein
MIIGEERWRGGRQGERESAKRDSGSEESKEQEAITI